MTQKTASIYQDSDVKTKRLVVSSSFDEIYSDGSVIYTQWTKLAQIIAGKNKLSQITSSDDDMDQNDSGVPAKSLNNRCRDDAFEYLRPDWQALRDDSGILTYAYCPKCQNWRFYSGSVK
ncbi:MAG: hypothetical protein OXF30_00965 [Candidatus Saccharibacteria bacterium]|nr:hypothetical protein [Candidatus Saccharibacteria bacterium]